MLTSHDELLCHQLSTTFDHVSQSDLRWTERIVMYGFDKSGDINVMTGLARYPNRNVTDAYAMVTRRGGQTTVVRMSTELRPDTAELGTYTVGRSPTRSKNRCGVCERCWPQRPWPEPGSTVTRPVSRLRADAGFSPQPGRVIEDARRFYQNGELEGWIEVGDERIDIDPQRWWFGRDHSWGVRHGPGGGSLPEGTELQPAEIPDGVLYYMGIFQFDDELVHFAQRETSAGERWQFEGELLYPIDSGHEPGKIIDVEHDLKFRDELRVIRSGTFTIHRGDRSTSTIDVTPLCDFWPGLAGYMEVNGYASGYWRGTDFIDGYTVDTGDLAVIRPVSMLSETLCEVRMDGKVGHGLVEMVFMGAYPVTGTRVGNRGAVDRRRTTAGAGTRCAKDDSRRRLGTHRQLATSRGRLFHRDIPVRRCRIERSVECWPGVSPSSRPRDTSRLRPAPTVPDHAATGRLTGPSADRALDRRRRHRAGHAVFRDGPY
ncbi:hypothetical protein I552_8091 [Mycobacterium xenopi 3993]|nr:hypothetical protein I552_8091 [Mycobacterium xenopi 3993]